jgi:hypothetical protein
MDEMMMILFLGNRYFTKDTNLEELQTHVREFNEKHPNGWIRASLRIEKIEISKAEVFRNLPKYIKAKETQVSGIIDNEDVDEINISVQVQPTNGLINETGWKRLNKFFQVLHELKIIS